MIWYGLKNEVQLKPDNVVFPVEVELVHDAGADTVVEMRVMKREENRSAAEAIFKNVF